MRKLCFCAKRVLIVTYLKQRIKNEQMQLKLQSVKQMSANQEERLKEMKEKKKQNKDGQNDKE